MDKEEYLIEYRKNYYNENIEQLRLKARLYKQNKKILKEKLLYQREYYQEYYIKYKDLIAEKNRIYYEINKKEKVIKEKEEKEIKIKKNEIMNLDLIIVEKKFVTLRFD